MGPLQRRRTIQRLIREEQRMMGSSRQRRLVLAQIQAEKEKLASQMTGEEFVRQYLEDKKTGWVDVPGGSGSVRVEKGTGCDVVRTVSGTTETITSSAALQKYFNPNLELDKYIDAVKDFEGSKTFMYLDGNGNVTIGFGHLIPDAAAAKALPFVDAPVPKDLSKAQKSHPLHVEKAYKIVKISPKVGQEADAFKTDTHIRLPQREIDKLFADDLAVFLKEVRNEFPDFDTYPQKAQWGILDLVFNLGLTKFLAQFTSFREAVNDRDWQRAKLQSGRGVLDKKGNPMGGLVKRNLDVRGWFKEAENAEPAFRKRKRCEVSWEKVRR